MISYLTSLQKLLPLKEPDSLAEKQCLYQLVARTLLHEWDRAEPESRKDQLPQAQRDHEDYIFARIMKHARNWMAHTQAFEQLTEQQLAFLWLLNLRALFKHEPLMQPYEQQLCALFKAHKLSPTQLKEKRDNELRTKLYRSFADAFDRYKRLNKIKLVNLEKIDFIFLIKELQTQDKSSQNVQLVDLLRMFWHGLSPVNVTDYQLSDRNSQFNIEYQCQFELHNYAIDHPDDFLCEMACCLYCLSY